MAAKAAGLYAWSALREAVQAADALNEKQVELAVDEDERPVPGSALGEVRA